MGALVGVDAQVPLAIEFSDQADKAACQGICQAFNGEYFDKVAASVSVDLDVEKGVKIGVDEFMQLIQNGFSADKEYNEKVKIALASFGLDGPKYRVVIAKAGQTLRYVEGKPITFSPESLKNAVPLFENTPLRVYKTDSNFFNHLETIDPELAMLFPAGMPDAMIGTLVNVVYNAETDSLESDAVIDPSTKFGTFFNNLLQQATVVLGGVDKFLGLSLVADVFLNVLGNVTRISKVDGVDVVSIPAAGGKWLKALQSAQMVNHKEDTMKDMLLKLLARFSPELSAEALAGKTDEELIKLLESAMDKKPVTKVLPYDDTELKEALDGVKAQMAANAAEAKKQAMFSTASDKINGTTLPTTSKDKLVKLLNSLNSLDETTIDSLIADEVKMIDALKSDKGFVGLGTRFSAGETNQEKLVEAISVSFGITGANEKKVGSLGLKAFYQEMTGDFRMEQKFRQGFAAISTAEFTNCLANVMNKRMQQAFGSMDYSEAALISTIKPVTDFRDQTVTNVGGFGIFPTVTELQAYQEVTHPTDWKTTYAVLKKGGLLPISWEMILNDDVGLINRLITNFGKAIRRTHGAYVFNLMTSNPTMYDSNALFIANPHANYLTTAFDRTQLLAVRTAMQKQTEPGSLFKLGLKPKHLWIPVDLEASAYAINKSDYTDAALQYTVLTGMFGATGENIHTVPFFTDATDWYVSGDTAACETIEMGYLNGRQEPELFVQNSPTQDSVFTDDKITYKIRFVFGGNVVEWRNLFGNVVSG
jgi:hypothetical protein